MDAELVEIRDFLAQHAPFDTLPAAVLDALPARLEVRYLRRGTVVLRAGGRTDAMYVVRTGAVDVRTADGELVDRVESGMCFAMSPLLEGTASAFDFAAFEDSLVLAVPAGVLDELCRTQPQVREGLERDHRRRLHRASATASPTAGAMRTRVQDLVGRAPESVTPSTTVRDAAATMRERGISSVLVMDGSRLLGIVTDRDLRNRVLAQGRDPGDTVDTVMTRDPVTTPSDALAFEVLLAMVDRGVHHLPVVEDGRVVGVVTSSDLMRLEHGNPVYLVADARRAADLDQLVALVPRRTEVVQRLVDQAAEAQDVTRVLTAVGDAVERRLIELAEAALGPPPTDYCWVTLGSRARREQALGGDQDHALILPDDAETSPEVDAYLAALAAQVVAGLTACGYPPCPGGVMATSPHCRRTALAWRRSFTTWMTTPDPEAVLAGTIYLDMRPLHGATALCADLRARVVARAPERPSFLAHLARQAVAHGPPIGFLRGLVVDRAGEHADTLDLKRRGIGPVVDVARVHALAAGQDAVGTRARLRAVTAAGRLDAGSEQDLTAALEVISQVRLRHQVRRLRAGQAPDSHVRPAELTPPERRGLRDAFRAVKHAQGVLARTYPSHYLS